MKLFSLKSLFGSKRNVSQSGGEPKWLINTSKDEITNADGALKIGAVYSSVRVIAETIATLPCMLYERVGEQTKKRAYDHPLWNRLHDSPNDFQDSVQFYEMIVGHAALRGNAFVHVEFAKGGTIFTPLHPDRVFIKVADGGRYKFYEYQKDQTTKVVIKPQNMIHIMGMSSDGYRGLSPIELAMRTANLAANQEKYATKMFANQAAPSGILKHPSQLSDPVAKRLKDDFERKYTGVDNTGTTILLEEGMEWQQIGLNNEQAQFLESRNFSVTDIARWFRVPPHKIGQLDKATFSNIEHQALEFMTDTIRPWLVRVEKAFARTLFTVQERKVYSIEFLADAILRGDIKTRHEVYAIGRQWGLYNADECRAKENMNPIPEENGQVYMVPSNMMPVEKFGEPTEKPAPTEPEPTQAKPEDEESEDQDQTEETNQDQETDQRTLLREVLRGICRRGFRRRKLQNTSEKRELEPIHFGHDFSCVTRAFNLADKENEVCQRYMELDPNTDLDQAVEKLMELEFLRGK